MTAAVASPARGPATFVARALRHASVLIGAALSGLLLLAAVVSLFWAPYPPAEIDIPNKLAPPSAAPSTKLGWRRARDQKPFMRGAAAGRPARTARRPRS